MPARQPIDPAWWNANHIDGLAMRETLAERDIKAVFNFLHRRGWSWAAIAQATDIGEQRVREIASGKRHVENYDVYVRVAVGLNIPRDYLGVGLRNPHEHHATAGALAVVSAPAELTTTLRHALEPPVTRSQSTNSPTVFLHGQPFLTGEDLVLQAARESADFGLRHGRSKVHAMNLEQLEADVRQLASDFVFEPPVTVVLRARSLRDQTFDLLDGHQWPQHARDLASLAGRLCGLLALASSDFFGRYDAAATQCRTAWLCAEMADHNELRSWIRSLQSGIAFWAGRWTTAVRLAQQAGTLAATAPSAARAAALEARALSRLDNETEVQRAVADSETARTLPSSHDAVGVMDFPEANRLRCAGAAYLWLGHHRAAESYLEAALASYEQEEGDAYAHIAVARADLAAARLAGHNLDGAAVVLQQILDSPPERRLAGVARRTTGLRTMLTGPQFKGSGTAGELATQIDDFRVRLTALPDGER